MVQPATLSQGQGLPPLGAADWGAVAALPWPSLIGNTLVLTLVAAALAVGLAPLLLLLATPWPAAGALVRGLWALGRLWPPPLTALLLLFVLQPGVLTGALALGFQAVLIGFGDTRIEHVHRLALGRGEPSVHVGSLWVVIRHHGARR